MKRTLIAVLVAALVVCCLAWNQTRREQLVLQSWCQENGLHIKAVHWSWRWEGGPFYQDWTGHSPLQRDWKGNIYRFEAVRDGETATQVYWAIITLCMPERPTLADFFKLRFQNTGNHVLQSANRAVQSGMTEEVVLACLLHDVAQELIRVDHGWWAAQIFEPYVPEKTAFAIRYHQALRFYPDPAVGYEYPELYLKVFGEDYKPEPYIEATYKMVRNHKWYDLPRMVTVNDLYSFEPGVVVEFEQFTDLLGRHFRQPKEGLGFDNTPVAHIWRSIAMPDHPL